MRLFIPVVFALVVGCQSPSGTSTQAPPPPALAAASVASDYTFVAQGCSSCPSRAENGLVQTSVQPTAGHTPPPGMVVNRVQTVTTYMPHCNLSMDYLQVRLPVPHLRIYTAPEKEVTQTQVVTAPQPVHVARPAVSLPSPQPAIAPARPPQPVAPTAPRIINLPAAPTLPPRLPTSAHELPGTPLPPLQK